MATQVQIEVITIPGCPHALPALELVRAVAANLAIDAIIKEVVVDSEEMARAIGFLGSPSIRVNGRDIEDKTTSEGALSCRVYEGGLGLPPQWLLECAILRALEPKGILFLCVHNSARSQMAEGIARSLAPQSIKVYSAGSKPTEVRPEAVAVLKEIGIDISMHRAKAISEVPASEIDTVITLCAEEECPVWLKKAFRLHWPLPDPAASNRGLSAFRLVRDELFKRLKVLFSRPTT